MRLNPIGHPSASPPQSLRRPAWRCGAPPALAAIAVFSAIFLLRAIRVWQPDFYMHLAVGRHIWLTGQIPRTGVLSHVCASIPWVDQSWLFQVLMYAVYHVSGLAGLAFVRTALVTLSYFLLWRTCRLLGASRATALALAFAAALFSWQSTEMRPYVASFVLFPLVLFLAHRYRAGGSPSVLIPIPFIAALWANMHAAYPALLLSLAALAAGDALDCLLRRATPGTLRRAAGLTAVVAASAVAVLMNPYGWRIYLVPFQISGSEVIRREIGEWRHLDLHRGLPSALLIAVTLVTLFADRWRLRSGDALLVALWAALAVSAQRQIPLFCYAAMPILGAHASVLLAASPRRAARRFARVLPAAFAAAMVVLGAWQMLIVEGWNLRRYEHRWGFGDRTELVPRRAVEFIRTAGLQGAMFNDFRLGGYLDWEVGEVHPVYQDGRIEAAGSHLFEQYLGILAGRDGWQQHLATRGVEYVVMGPDDDRGRAALRTELEASPDWAPAYSDDTVTIFVRLGGPNARLALTHERRARPGLLPEG